MYEIVLGRKAESSEVIENQLREHDSAISLVRSLCRSEEFATRLKGEADRWLDAASSAYLGYRAEDLAIFDQFAGAAPEPAPGFVTDFHGSRARISSLWDGVQHLDGVVLSKPVPGDYHAETAEWLGVLKAVLAAHGRFAAMELGAGMGPWLVASSTAARLRGIGNIRLLGVEADPSRFASMRENFRDNGIDPDQHVLLCGGVSVVSGKAKWPRSADPRNVAGGRPVRRSQIDESLDEQDLDYLEGMTDDLVDVDLVAFEELLRYEPLWDLVHLDVQGTEVELCAACLTMLSRCVRYLVVGTHSRKLDGDLLDLMFHAGWVLEHEKPARFVFNRQLRTLERMTSADGIQVWRNPNL
ncbi:MAG: hypothetical protein JOZ11_18660 [Alphaproteobacteria bacterium]|nr:hypothetical protein [Alphaproteobacteria bacterium]